ncbi:MAG TPA: lysylphosphatidylglycerol synthase transmembrane domain-containing protein [Polyangiaceae bacterium]|nr:lysylphosphatidylglycerol synthase transmembrane domain-containing protein [Polyangiaceae bacterium]
MTQTSTQPKERIARRLKSWVLPVLLLVASIVVLLRSSSHVTWAQLAAECGKAGPALILVFLAPAVGNALHMLGWRLLFHSEQRPRPWHAYRAFVAAQAGNELGLGVMGEPVKVAALPRKHREAAVAAMVMDNVTGAVALVAFFLSLGGFVLALSPHSSLARRAAIGSGVGTAVLLAIGLILWRARRAAPFLPSFLQHGKVAHFLERAGSTVFACRQLIAQRPGAVAGAVGLHYLGKLWMVIEMLLVMHLLGCGSLRGGVLFSLASAVGSLAGAPVPGQVGVLEASLLSTSEAAGVSLAAGIAIAVLRRTRGGLWILMGAIFSSTFWPRNDDRGEGQAQTPSLGGDHARPADFR